MSYFEHAIKKIGYQDFNEQSADKLAVAYIVNCEIPILPKKQV